MLSRELRILCAFALSISTLAGSAGEDAAGPANDHKQLKDLLRKVPQWVEDQKDFPELKKIRASMKSLGNDALKTLSDLAAKQNKDRDVRIGAIFALGDLADKEAVPVRGSVARAFGSIGDPKAGPTLIQMLGDKNDGVVMFAAQSLGKVGGDTAKARLLEHYGKATDIFVRKYLGEAVKDIEAREASGWAGRMGVKPGKEGLPALAELMKSTNKAHRLGAVTELRQREVSQDFLLKAGVLLEDKDEEVRTAAAQTLMEFGENAVPALIQALKPQSSEGRFLALCVLRKHAPSSKGHVAQIQACLDDPSTRHRGAAASLLCVIGPQAAPATDRLIRALADADKRVALTTSCALGCIGQAAVSSLIKALKTHKNKQVRALAAMALGHVGVAPAAHLTSGGFGGPEVWDELRMLPNAKGAVDPLVEALKDDDPQVRCLAATALGRMESDSKKALDALKALDGHKDADVKMAARMAILKITSALERKNKKE